MVERQEAGRFNASRAGTHSFRAYLGEIGINKNRANECERIGAIPDHKLPNAFKETAIFMFAWPLYEQGQTWTARRHLH